MGRGIWNPDVAGGHGETPSPRKKARWPTVAVSPRHAAGLGYILLGHKDLETYGGLNQ